jgi:tetratricopeptide (TPR) repeat protein
MGLDHCGEEAFAEYKLAQRLDPANVVAASNIGFVSCRLGRYERGIAALKDALALDPNFLTAHDFLLPWRRSPGD